MKAWIFILYSVIIISVIEETQPNSSSTQESCDSLCLCEEKDGTIFVNCEERGIEKLSQINVPLSQLFQLSLLNNKLSKLQTNGFFGLSNMISLHLGFNNIADIDPGAFNGLTNLKELHINHNSLEIIRGDSFHGLENLEFLQADNNFITTIESSAFSKLSRLKVLILNDNAIEFLPTNIFRFVPLTHLDLRGNQLQTLPYVGFLEHIGRIVDLQLEDNKWVCNCDLLQLKIWLENMPSQSIIDEVICNSPPNLKNSILNRLKKETLCPSDSISKIDNPSESIPLVVTTSISDNHIPTKLMSLPKGSTKVPNLLHTTKPATQPPGIFCPIPCHCTSHVLSGILIHCQEQNIESLSDIGLPPKNPRKLFMAGNIIQMLLKSDLVEYASLEMLHLGNNRIEVIEEGSFLNFTRLQKLYLNGNHLTKINGNLFLGLQLLEYLYLEYNLIKEILPGTFTAMPKLKVLYLNNNRLQTLPPYIFSGVPLVRLNLKSNQFSHFPVSNGLDELDLLIQIELEDNPWDCTCDLIGFKQWIQKLSKTTMINEIICKFPESLAKQDLRLINSEILCPGLAKSPNQSTQASFIIVTTPVTTTTINTADTLLKSITDFVPLSVLILGLLVAFITIVFCAAGVIVLVLQRRKRCKKKQTDEQIRENSPVCLQYSMYGHKMTHKTSERPSASLYEQRMVNPMVQVYRTPPFSPKNTEYEEQEDEKDVNDPKHLHRSLLERENDSPLTGPNLKFRAVDHSPEFLSFQDASSLYRNILEKERELQQLGITEYLRKSLAQLQPDTDIRYPGTREELKLMETLMYARPRSFLVEQTKNEYFELKANLHAEPDYLEVLEQQT
ncbi:SLIT and NTRK-like protein 6 [Microcaecilia unicolor]|uniref:SLIT and NTRK-like protein 6 n=1 Tax=Microcaecilia unicolor TaxID=1415580 RepID=A0A6P7XVG1_9AMPH|nr:SLIT and NTRK-like protein 6 [Microcaecilia unicolor]XP_030056488.1 SLIT and NTRK-like protein 6 [Microcaecilia unicolor]